MYKFRLPNWHIAWLSLVLIVIYLPLFSMVQFSFNNSKRSAAWYGFSLRHYEAAFNDTNLMASFANSFLVGMLTAVMATFIGLAAALSLERFNFPGHRAYLPVVALPLAIPEICFGIALLIFFRMLGWPNNLPWPLSLGKVLIAHVAFTWPFTTIILRAKLRQIDIMLELASRDLGANSWQTLWQITLPQLYPALIASSLLAFTISLDDFIVTFFVASPTSQLLPVKIFSMMRVGSTPVVDAVSTVIIALTFVAVALAAWLNRRK